MKANAILTPREAEVAELLAWGAAKKEVADALKISTRTIENTARNIYGKIGIQKAKELCVWWFCTRCGVSFDLSPIKRSVIAAFLLILFLPYEFTQQNKDVFLVGGSRTRTEIRAGRGRRRSEENFSTFEQLTYD